MDLLKLGAGLFIRSASAAGAKNLTLASVIPALQSLLAGPDGKVDIFRLVSQFTGSGLASLASSWLGDGANQELAPEKVIEVLGDNQVTAFASKLGLDKSIAATGLAEALPQLIDKASSGGSLLNGDTLGKTLGGLFGR